MMVCRAGRQEETSLVVRSRGRGRRNSWVAAKRRAGAGSPQLGFRPLQIFTLQLFMYSVSGAIDLLSHCFFARKGMSNLAHPQKNGAHQGGKTWV